MAPTVPVFTLPFTLDGNVLRLNPGLDLALPQALLVGASETRLTGETEAGIDRLKVEGTFRNFHEVRFRSTLLATGSATVTGSGSGVGLPRMVFQKGQFLEWVEPIEPGWATTGVNFAWSKEEVGSGNAHWRLEVDVLNFLSGTDDVQTGSLTQIYDANVPVPATADRLTYLITNGQFASTPQVFGIPPLVHVVLTRVNDGGDSYSGPVSVTFTSVSQV